MKRFNSLLVTMAVLVSIVAWISPKWAFSASPYAVTVSTVVPNASTAGSSVISTAGYPNITGNVAIRKLWFSNDGAAETVNVWKNCTSSTTAALVWTGIASSTTTNVANQGNTEMDSLPNTFVVANPCFSKGLAGAGTVKVHVQYQ